MCHLLLSRILKPYFCVSPHCLRHRADYSINSVVFCPEKNTKNAFEAYFQNKARKKAATNSHPPSVLRQ
jgi:hypothetical protein